MGTHRLMILSLISGKKMMSQKKVYPSKEQQRDTIAYANKRSPEQLRKRRQRSARKSVYGKKDRPRLSIYRSNNHIYAQVIDDEKMHTMVATGTLDPSIKTSITGNNKAAAQIVGKEIAKLCIEKGISKVVFDRAGYLYHGRVKSLADAAREGGLIF